ncbi:MAG: DUF2911 domain-containing protein [Bacteroidota bacterium]
MRIALPLAVLLAAAPALAQRQLTTPRTSPHARVAQTVGLTTLSVDYHRPAVNGRTVWGDLEPYGEVWRAGANENTVFEVSTDVEIEGEALPAGSYGLHMVPTDGDWTIIFSTVDHAWGSYSYDPSEDALRVTVTPRPGPMTERLVYRFDDPSDDGATLILAWDELEVPVEITVDTPEVVIASMQEELRGVAGFFADGWHQIATYALMNGVHTEAALGWAERAVGMDPAFAHRMTQAALLDRLGRSPEATTARNEAFASASEDEVRAYARSLRRAGMAAEADATLARLGD